MPTIDLFNDVMVNCNQVSLSDQIPKKAYAKFKAVMERAGGKWSKSDQAFRFIRDPLKLIERIRECGTSGFNKFHLYETPPKITNFINQYSLNEFRNDPNTDTIKILEPSIGCAALIEPLIKELKTRYPDRSVELHAYDIDPINVSLCEQLGISVVCADFLDVEVDPSYDLVILNPPYNSREYQRHLFHAQKFLKARDGALLICVAPTHHLFSCTRGFLKHEDDRKMYLEALKVNNDFGLETFDKSTFDKANVQTSIFMMRHCDYEMTQDDIEYLYNDSHLAVMNISPEEGQKSIGFVKTRTAISQFRIEPTESQLQAVLDTFMANLASAHHNAEEVIFTPYIPYFDKNNGALIDRLIFIFPRLKQGVDALKITHLTGEESSPYEAIIDRDQFALNF